MPFGCGPESATRTAGRSEPPTFAVRSNVWRYNLSAGAQARAVQQGRADWMFEQIPAKLRSAIAIHHPAQLRVSPVFGTEFLQINTRLPPFDHLAVRRALNYAIDRDEVARLYGGP